MEKFYLKWNDFVRNASQSFRNLRKEEDFYDVTLVSDDEKHFPAHRVVLSASSEFFKNILKRVNHSNPLIYLTGITSKELLYLINYIYEGEIQICQEDLEDFLGSAQKLKIDGLVGDNNLNHQESNKPDIVQEDTFKDELIEDFRPTIEKRNTEKSLSLIGQDPSREEAAQAVDELVTKDGDLWMCKVCSKTVKHMSSIVAFLSIM